MTNEKKQEFTLRISNANASNLVVILCDIFEEYCADAVSDIENKDIKAFHVSVAKARKVLSEMLVSFDRDNEIANAIYELYRFVERMIIKADIKLDAKYINDAVNIISKLNESYKQAAKSDGSAPLMANAEEVYVGMTYGRNNVASASMAQSNRGFFA